MVTLLLLSCALTAPTHELGDTAVFGTAYLWGESSIRSNTGAEIRWFVDCWEMAQHGMFVLTVWAAWATLVREKGLGLVAFSFTALVLLDFERSIEAGGVPLPACGIFEAWALTLCVLWATTRLESTGRRPWRAVISGTPRRGARRAR